MVSLFIGDDVYSKEKAIEEKVSSILGGADRQLNYRVFYGGGTDENEILGYIGTAPFMSAKRVVVIKDFERLDSDVSTRLIAYIHKPSKSTHLIVETDSDSTLKLLAGYADIRRFDGMGSMGYSSWIRDLVKAANKTITSEAIEVFKELQGEDALRLTHELEKVIAFTGTRRDIKAEDVEAVAGRSIIASVFDLTDAIEEKKLDDALMIVSDLILAGKRPYEIIGLLCWHLKRLLRAKAFQMKGVVDYDIADTLKIGRRYQENFFRSVRNTEVSAIRSRVEMLMEADMDIKRTKFDPLLTLEFTIIRLCLGR